MISEKLQDMCGGPEGPGGNGIGPGGPPGGPPGGNGGNGGKGNNGNRANNDGMGKRKLMGNNMPHLRRICTM